MEPHHGCGVVRQIRDGIILKYKAYKEGVVNMGEPRLDIRNTGNARCMICNTPALSYYDHDLFFRELDYEQFLPKANEIGFKVPHADFITHLKHIYVYKKIELKDNSNSTEIVSDMINSLRTQLATKEAADETGDSEYTKKSELLKSLIELKGKFDGSYNKSSDTSTNFKELLQNQLKSAVAQESTRINKIADVAANPMSELDTAIFSEALEAAARKKAEGEKQ